MILFGVIAALTLGASAAALSLRNLVHCALALAVALSGLAALYLKLGAQFVGFAQILIYVGAVAILIVFAILLTRGSEPDGENSPKTHSGASPPQGERGSIAEVPALSKPDPQLQQPSWPKWLSGFGVAGLVFAVLVTVICKSPALTAAVGPAPEAPVRQIGEELMTRYVLPLEVLGLLLTAALIGAVVLAMRDSESEQLPK